MHKKAGFLFIIVIIFLTLICISCVKDDLLENYEGLPKTTAGMVIKKIRFQDVRSNRQAFQSLQNFRKPNSLTQRGMYYEEFGVFIDTATIVSIEKDNKHSLTFRIINDEKTNTIENLVLQANDNDSYTAYITTYDVTEQEQQQLLNGETLLPKKPSAITKTTTNSRISIGGDGAECAEIHSIQREECPDGKGGYIPFTGENNNNCAGMPVTVTYLVVTINLECMSGGGSSNPGTRPGTPYPGSNPGGTNPGGNGTSPGTQPGNPGTPPDPTEPIRDPGDGTPVITTPVLVVNRPKTPCNQLKEFGQADKMNLKPGIDSLKHFVNNTPNKIEYGLEVIKQLNYDGETYDYRTTLVTSNEETEVTLTTSRLHIGAAHTHPKKGYAMFSFGDVKGLIDFYDVVSTNYKEEVFSTLVCKDKAGNVNVYTLKIEDINMLKTRIATIWNHPNYSEYSDPDKRLKEIHKMQAETFRKSNNQLEKSFLQQFLGFGISLYKATDDSLTNWSKLELSTTPPLTVNSTPCN